MQNFYHFWFTFNLGASFCLPHESNVHKKPMKNRVDTVLLMSVLAQFPKKIWGCSIDLLLREYFLLNWTFWDEDFESDTLSLVLKCVTTYLWNSASPDELNHFMVLQVHKSKTNNLSVNEICQEFVRRKKSRKIGTFKSWLSNAVCKGYLFRKPSTKAISWRWSYRKYMHKKKSWHCSFAE